MYNTTAFLYEHTAAFEDPSAVCNSIQDIFIHFGLNSTEKNLTLGDLGCGTGLLSFLFAEKGWQVFGIDQSKAMLTEAKQALSKQPKTIQNNVTFSEGDITADNSLNQESLDGAVSLCNVVNHLITPEQVQNFAEKTYKALKSNGIFILDSDRLQAFTDFFHHPPVVVWDDGKQKMTRTATFNEATGRVNHTARIEQYQEDNLVTVSKEAMALQYYDEAALNQIFIQAGFSRVASYPFNPFPNLYVGFIPKVLWVWQKTREKH